MNFQEWFNEYPEQFETSKQCKIGWNACKNEVFEIIDKTDWKTKAQHIDLSVIINIIKEIEKL